ncbi:Peptidoglycan-binding (PGRP) domain of peptidoglycan hydrolases-containing protein [Picosynechococcus sp. OG1]|nr:peptidoglycan binding protein; putative penicillin-resistant DD-carboxypeptidase [Picosynechococcus sp. PCC 7002]SMH43075.1 Peptidoglycan-binding (PGRP) domain of peptidoglycan hydrolases-containing protein [Picosynechococcus sp. OG1]SMQ79212.1 Peptidoglycan-binding (PGRP) domain of peptidoglycan hydrolases-containing protein [Synechococcus sp. 7002]
MKKIVMSARQTVLNLGLSTALILASSLGLSPLVSAQSPRPELRIGSTGTVVQELQTTLRLLGYYSGETTGTYDEATVIAVYQFQKAAQIPQTGVMDRTTWETLFPISAANLPVAEEQAPTPTASSPTTAQNETPATPAQEATDAEAAPSSSTNQTATSTDPDTLPLLKEGMEGDSVKLLQTRLQALGYYTGRIDGIFGPNTRIAVIAAQTALKLDGDGIVGAQTWRKLLN